MDSQTQCRAGRRSLPLYTKEVGCSDCGRCCQHMGTPPMYAAAFPLGGKPVWWFVKSEDAAILARAPRKVREELRDYYHAVQRGEIADRSGQDVPCLWYDEVTRRCRHYEFRPTICREFEAGGEECAAWRRK